MFVPLLQETPKKALVHCTKPKFSPERHSLTAQNPKMFSRRKDVESYSQMPGKRILALKF
jgi:predicted ribosome quality control (RQC) complex YloA/Tae2 family protein